MKKTNSEEEKKKIKKIVALIIIIIIILLLITSCTSRYWGRIGDYQNEVNVDIDDDTNDKEIILNKDLIFDMDRYEMFVNQNELRLTYTYQNINPQEFTCTTSNSDIATCYVKDKTVVVLSKGTGEVEVLLETLTNGKKYQAKTKVTIKEANGYIALSSSSGTINLKYNNKLLVAYSLVRITGQVEVSLEDNSIAEVTIQDGNLVIIGKKVGTTKITVSVIQEGKKYLATYHLTVKEETIESNRPSKPTKEKDSSLKSLTLSSSQIDFKSNVHEYHVSVEQGVKNVTLKAVPNSSKAKVTYKVNGKTVSSLDAIPLNEGDNQIEIEVTAEDGSKTTYTVTVTRSKPVTESSNALKELTVNKGTLNPRFSENILDYHVTVPADTKEVDLKAVPKDSKAKVTYKYNGVEVDNLSNLPLTNASNQVEITVTDENGKTRTYTVTIEKAKSTNNNLKDLKVSDGLSLTPSFTKDNQTYTLNVPYNQDKVTLFAEKEDSKSTVHYHFNGQERNNLEDLDLLPGDNTVEVTVTSEEGESKTYTITVHKCVRTIQFEQSSYNIPINKTSSIIYQVFEDDVPLREDQYNLSDIQITWDKNYDGKATIEKGYIVLNPNPSMADQTYDLTIAYANTKDKTTITFIEEEYYLNTDTTDYNLDFTSSNTERDIVLNNNLFNGEIVIEETATGVKIYEKNNKEVTVELTFDKDALELESISGDHSLALHFKVKTSGDHQIQIKGTAYGKLVHSFNITIHAELKYILKLDANGGYFDEFTTSYEFTVKEKEIFDLTTYQKGYYIDEDCLHYAFENFNDQKDGLGTTYDQTITLTKDITLYAIYSKTPTDPPIPTDKNLYLVDVDLFHNEEYFKLYNRDKIIYPGATGSYTMTFDNNTASTIEIKSITLEEDTICIDEDGVNGCLNMGYVLKDYQGNYYLGEPNRYEVLYKNERTERNNEHTKNVITLDNPIVVEQGKSTEISLLWQWVNPQDEENNRIDTLIGQQAKDQLNNLYQLTVSIQFTTQENTCEHNGG